MRSFRFHPSIWLLAAALWLAGTTPSLAQALSAEDTELLDAVALLYLGDEEGRQVYPEAEPIKRSIDGSAIVFEYTMPSQLFGTTDPAFRHRAESRYERALGIYRLTAPCIVEVETTIDYSQADSRSAFGLHATTQLTVLDFSNYQRLDFEDASPASVSVIFRGDDVVCFVEGSKRNCTDDYDQKMVLEGTTDTEWRIKRAKTAPEVVKKHCPGRAN